MKLDMRDYHSIDRDDVAHLWHEAWLASGHATEADPTLGDYRERLDTEGRGWLTRLACANVTIVGFVAMDLEKRWLRQLFVLPTWQRRGVGMRLLDEARRAMPHGFWLRTDYDNRAARCFYEARGLVLDGEAMHPERGHRVASYRWLPPRASAGLP